MSNTNSIIVIAMKQQPGFEQDHHTSMAESLLVAAPCYSLGKHFHIALVGIAGKENLFKLMYQAHHC